MANIASKFRPPPGRRGFKIPDPSDSLPLVYVAWGARRFGESPVAAANNYGYVYAAVLEGTPNLVMTDHAPLQTQRGTVAVFDEHCSMGWEDAANAHSKILIWIWNAPPTIASMRTAQGDYAHWNIPLKSLALLERIHKECRQELSTLDAYTKDALEGYQRALDVAILRSQPNQRSPKAHLNRYEIGVNWMHQNLNAQHPVSELAVYLGVSESTLQRIFIRRSGQRPLAVFQAIKGKAAQTLLAEGHSVKGVAYQLGYKHPNDFSRFYHKTFGCTPSS